MSQRQEQFGRIVNDLQNPDVQVRRVALAQLAALEPGNDALERVMQVATGDESAALRSEALRLHQDLKARYEEHLRSRVTIRVKGEFQKTEFYAALNSEELDLRLEALRQFQEAPDPRGRDLIFSMLRREDDQTVLAEMLRAAGQVAESQHMGYFQPFLQSSTAAVAVAALTAIGRIGGDLAAPMIRPLIKGRLPEVRVVAAKLTAAIDPSLLIEDLGELLQADDEDLQQLVIQTLPVLPPESGLAMGLDMLHKCAHPGRLRSISRFLGDHGTEATLEPLAKEARSLSIPRSRAAKEARAAIAARLGIAIEEAAPAEVREEGEREKRRATQRMQVRPAGEKPTAGLLPAPPSPAGPSGRTATQPAAAPAAPARKGGSPHSTIALVTAAGLTALLAFVTFGPKDGRRSFDPTLHFRGQTHPALLETAAGHPPRGADAKGIDFEGRVVDFQAEPVGVTLITGPCLVHVSFKSEKGPNLTALKRGAKLRVRGTIEGRSPFGGVRIQEGEVSSGGAAPAG